MISNMKEHHLQDADLEEIADFVKGTRRRLSEPDFNAALAVIDTIRKLPPIQRHAIFEFTNSGLLCRECGATSCIHGYSDE